MRAVGASGRNLARVLVSTALGDFVVEASTRGVRAVTPLRREGPTQALPHQGDPPRGSGGELAWRHAQAAGEALRRYARGEPEPHAGALDLSGSPFQRAVWERLREIPFGATSSYGALALDLGMGADARAVGAAAAGNPLCILVPCHRLVGADGSLRGFAWGLDLKRRLLNHEGILTLVLPGV